MRDINIQVHNNHTVDFQNDYAGLNRENLQGNITFNFDEFVNGQARAEIVINNQEGYILLEQVGETYTLPIKSSLLTGDSILMQLVIQEPSSYELTTDTEIDHNKTYYVKDGNSFEVVEHPVKANLDEYYEASTPIWKSDVFYLAVGQSINATSTIPEEYPTWVEIINNLINETEEAITRAENVNISSEQLSNGVKVITTNQNGEQTITIVPQGPQGEQGPAGSIKIIVVETLPTENIDTSAIYLVPSQEPTTQNNYEEYVYINNQWEKLGEVPIATDLTDYVKNTDYATASKGGVIRINSAYGVYIYNGQLYNNPISYSLYQNSQDTMFIGKGTLENVITGKGLVSNTIIKTTTNTTAGNVYDVTYINSQLGDIATALNTINGENI